MHLNHKTKNVFFFHCDGKAFIPLTSLQADYSAFTVCSVFSFDLQASLNNGEFVYLLMAIFQLNHDVLDYFQCFCQPNVQASNSRIVKSLVSDRLQLLKVKQGLLLPNNNLSSTHKPKWPLPPPTAKESKSPLIKNEFSPVQRKLLKRGWDRNRKVSPVP